MRHPAALFRPPSLLPTRGRTVPVWAAGDKLTDFQNAPLPAATATLTLQDQREAYALLGANDANLRRMRELTRAKIIARGETVTILGASGSGVNS